MSKRGRSRRNGPKNTRYFFAFSERRIVDDMSMPLAYMILIENNYFRPDEIARVDLPIAASDIDARYGFLAVPQDHLDAFLLSGMPYVRRKIAPRDLNGCSDIALLLDWKIPNSFRGEGHAYFLQGHQPIPYRTPPGIDMSTVLEDCGYPQLETVDAWKRYRTARLRQNQALNIDFHSIPIDITARATVVDALPAGELQKG